MFRFTEAFLSTAQITVDNTVGGTLISAAGGKGEYTLITNHGTTAVYYGAAGVTTLTGALLPGVVGASITIPTLAAIYGITAAGNAVVSRMRCS